MTENPVLHKVAAQDEAGRPLVDRRRPGRVENVSPHLIPLLRGEAVIQEPIDPETDRRTAKKLVSTERAITVVMLLTSLLWAFVLLGGWSWLMDAPSDVSAQAAAKAPNGKAFTASPY